MTFPTWRDAELLVQLRRYTFLEADGASRPGAFAAVSGSSPASDGRGLQRFSVTSDASVLPWS